MHQVKLIVQVQQRFRSTEKKISAKIEVAEKVIDDFGFRWSIKIDQYVAAEDQIHAFHEQDLGVVLQIKAAERDQLFHFRLDLKSFVVKGNKIFPFEIVRRRA